MNVESSSSLPSLENFVAADVATLEGALAAEDGFAEAVSDADEVEDVTPAPSTFLDEPEAGSPARHSA